MPITDVNAEVLQQKAKACSYASVGKVLVMGF